MVAKFRPSFQVFVCFLSFFVSWLERDLHAQTEMFTVLVFCPFSFPLVAQVACTNWKRVMVVLSQSLISPSSGKPYSDPEAVPPELVHNSSLHLTFAKYCHSANTVSVPHKDKFIFFLTIGIYVIELEGVRPRVQEKRSCKNR